MFDKIIAKDVASSGKYFFLKTVMCWISLSLGKRH